jgi:hypothetical protein
MDKIHQELIDVLTRSCNIKKRESKAASFFVTGMNKAQMIHDFIFSKH